MLNLRHFALAAAALLMASPAALADALTVSASAPTVTQNFDAMGSSVTLPDGWVIDRNLSAPRTVGSFASASTDVMYTGAGPDAPETASVNLPSNAKNGTWNFASSADLNDRAIGGLTTTVANGTRCLSLMTSIRNDGDYAIERLNLSYDIEKYRNGSNPAGFVVQLYTSTNGTNWTAAGDDFKTLFNPDGETLGAAVVPITTTSVNKPLLIDVAQGETIYLAWNISVASGTSPNNAPGYALDNISITAVFADPAVEKHYIYVEDHTGWDAIAIYAADGSFGPMPGQLPTGTKSVNGVSYKVFEYSQAPVTFELNNTASLATDPVIISTLGDYYYCASPQGVTLIADPESYTGWVDPNAPVFVPSGIYLRGDVNSWAATEEWEFSDQGDGNYILYNRNLSGAFKVADASWSSACNYGSNGANILPDTPYQLVSGTDNNISCGGNAYTCTEIRLNITDGVATLFLKSNDDPTGLTTVYVIGDHNAWNYMNATGALNLDTADGLFKGKISMPAAADGLSHWRIYQRLGMGGSWGAPGNVDMTESALSGTLEKGSTANAAVAPGTYSFTFDLQTGAYTLTLESAAVVDMRLQPAEVVLVPELPEQVKILSLNNSLIYYNDQDAVFNSIAESMGKDASWTKHTLLGKSLNTHWEEGEGLAADGTPSAKMLVRSEAWSHIILQEQSALPRTDPATTLASVKKWIGYIRENCPNPNAVIILPMNWAYAGDWTNYTAFNEQFARNYAEIAGESGAIVCPVATAYEAIFEAEGSEGANLLYQDDRHPTAKATYLAACMEFQLIFNEDALTINSAPAGVTAADAEAMRSYASAAMGAYANRVNHHNRTVAYGVKLIDENGLDVPADGITYSVSGGGSIDADGNFTADGTLGEYTVTATNGQFTRTAKVKVAKAETVVITYPAIEMNNAKLTVSEDFNTIGTDANAQLPEAWRIDRQTVGPRAVGQYGMASETTMYAGGVNLPSNAKNGTWNFGNGEDADRALGGITTGVADGSRAINLYTHITNTGTKNLVNLIVSYDIEKYRKGSNAAGFAVQLYYSIDGRNWKSAGESFYTKLDPDNATAGYATVPGEVIPVEATLPVDLERGCDLYLAWNISAASGDNCASAMALAIDNFSITAELPAVPTAKHYIYADDQTGWASLGLYAWGDSELFGAWPGEAPVDEVAFEGNVYKKFLLDAEGGSYNLIFNNWNNGKQLPDYNITANRDYVFRLTDSSLELLDLDITGAVSIIADSADLPAVYYNLQGQRIDNPTKGIYVRLTGNRAEKVVIR